VFFFSNRLDARSAEVSWHVLNVYVDWAWLSVFWSHCFVCVGCIPIRCSSSLNVDPGEYSPCASGQANFSSAAEALSASPLQSQKRERCFQDVAWHIVYRSANGE